MKPFLTCVCSTSVFKVTDWIYLVPILLFVFLIYANQVILTVWKQAGTTLIEIYLIKTASPTWFLFRERRMPFQEFKLLLTQAEGLTVSYVC